MVEREGAEEALDNFLDKCLDDLGPVTLEEILQTRAQDMREIAVEEAGGRDRAGAVDEAIGAEDLDEEKRRVEAEVAIRSGYMSAKKVYGEEPARDALENLVEDIGP